MNGRAEQLASSTTRAALITGSSRGVGAETARQLALRGYRVVVNYRDKAKRAESVVDEIRSSGGQAIAIRADLTDVAAVDAMIHQVGDTCGGLDLLVLNASGGMERGADFGYALRLNRDAQVGLVGTCVAAVAGGVTGGVRDQRSARTGVLPGSAHIHAPGAAVR